MMGVTSLYSISRWWAFLCFKYCWYQETVYLQNGYIVGSPSLVDLDGDEDMEIGGFTTQRGSNSGELFAIHHDGVDMDGFPVY